MASLPVRYPGVDKHHPFVLLLRSTAGALPKLSHRKSGSSMAVCLARQLTVGPCGGRRATLVTRVVRPLVLAGGLTGKVVRYMTNE